MTNRYAIGGLLGFTIGFLLLHPLSMFFSGGVHPNFKLNPMGLLNAFSVHHLPMAGYFGAIGTLFGLAVVYLTLRLAREQARVKLLEGLLPICSYCKRIRKAGADPQDAASWQRIDHYIAEHTGAEFTHGACPECFEKMFADEAEDEGAPAGGPRGRK